MALQGVEALLFDVFGTVVDWQGSVAQELKARNPGVEESVDWVAFAKEWRQGYYAATSWSGCSLRHIGSIVGRLWDEDTRRELNLVWHRLNGRWNDTTEGLFALKKHAIIGTLSNGNVKCLVDMAKHADLPWDVVFSGELLGSYKPNPKVYLGAIHHLSLPAEKVALVAAHIYDLRNAAKHGMKTVYVRRPTEDAELQADVKTKAEGGEVDIIVDSGKPAERIGAPHDSQPGHAKWLEQRREQKGYAGHDPEVLIMGYGQSGLDLAARVKHYRADNLGIEKKLWIGNQWRERYEALCCTTLFMSSTVTKAIQDEEARKWAVTVKKADELKCVFNVDHMVDPAEVLLLSPKFLNKKNPKVKCSLQVLTIPPKTIWERRLCLSLMTLHPTMRNMGSTFVMSVEEAMPRIASRKDGAPVAITSFSPWFQHCTANAVLTRRLIPEIHEADQKFLHNLWNVGSRTSFGKSGFLSLLFDRGSGYYPDVGVCQKIIDGEIKLKNDAHIEHFVKIGLKFDNGTENEVDAIKYRTTREGYALHGGRAACPTLGISGATLLGPASTKNLSLCTEIKAKQEGLFGTRYSAPIMWG
ncbi:hypothetical protein NM688_g5666 [Phlebia brevispora]|uniref:Uncharacterized protein n=1 Tax=Phlebia brevispora TaxID=194682 RepID=A0ACC1SRJ9_9APHY|nr:hypothetical protein NM688_g5666 [Phlebia brevispora]